jgi:hydrogenase 3 maturation protease
MRSLKDRLRDRLRGAERIAVLAVGSELRCDDAAGILAARGIERRLERRAAGGPLRVFLGHTAPENLTGEIVRYRPTHLIVIDAADLGARPGSCRILDWSKTGEGGPGTHRMPLGLTLEYLRSSIACDVTIVGIQPASLEACAPPTRRVRAAAGRLARAIAEAAPGG